MADMYAIFGIFVLVGLSYPALLTGWWLLFPERVERARLKISETPKKSFWIGLLAAFISSLPALFLLNLPSQFTKVLGWIWVVVVLGTASLGAAGLAAEVGLRLNWKNDGQYQSLGAFLRGTVLIELASVFPVVGWLLVLPVSTLVSLGGAVQVIRNKKDDRSKEEKESE